MALVLTVRHVPMGRSTTPFGDQTALRPSHGTLVLLRGYRSIDIGH